LDKLKPRALIYHRHFDLLAGMMLEYPDSETGGDLFGFWTYSGFPVVQYVLGPGPKARRSQTAFFQDREYLILEGNRLQKAHGFQHIGEWHSHHVLGLAEPSGGDCATIQRAMRDYSLPSFLLIIGQLVPSKGRRHKPVFNGYLFRSDKPEKLGWVCLDGSSPLQDRLDQGTSSSSIQTPATEIDIGPCVSLADRDSSIPERPSFDDDAWMKSPSGRQLLLEIDRRLKLMGGEARFFDDKSLLALKFFIESIDFRVVFPKDFPQSRASLAIISADGQVTDIVGDYDPKKKPLAFIDDAIKATRQVRDAKEPHVMRVQTISIRIEGNDGLDD
jgi:hypothetical protein